jgi:tetratricopeptide (TPR) repeat protein
MVPSEQRGEHGLRGRQAVRMLVVALVALAVSVFEARPQTSQSSTNGELSSKQSPEQIKQAVAQYETFLRSPPPGTTSFTFTMVRLRLGTAYFLLQLYSESLHALAPLVKAEEQKSSRQEANVRSAMAQAWLICGLDHLEMNQATVAITPLRQSLALDPMNANARMALGDAFARTDRMQDAEQQYEEQLKQTPSLPNGWYKLGMAHIKLGSDWKNRLTTKVPAPVPSQELVAEDLLTGEANWDAARLLLGMVKSAPLQPELHSDLGRALIALGYTKSAGDEFRKELSFDPDDPLAMLGLAEAEALQQNWNDADAALEKLARSQPRLFARLVESAPAGPLREAWNDGTLKLPESMKSTPKGDFWKTWLSTSSLSPEMVTAIAQPDQTCAAPSPVAESTPGVWLSEACYRRLLRQIEQRPPSTSAERAKLVEAMFRLGDDQAAMQRARSNLQFDPRDTWAMYWLSRAHAELAGDCFVKLALLDPQSPRVHQMLAERYLGWGQFPQAASEYQTAIQLAPSLPDLHLGLGDTYTRMLDWPHAVNEYHKTLELARGSLEARAELGHAYVKLGEWQLAVTELSQIPSDAPRAAAAKLDLANAEDQLGETRQAITDLLPFANADRNGDIHWRLAAFYRKLGDRQHANEAMQAFQELRAADLAVSHNEIQALEDEKASDPTAGRPAPH